MNVAHSIDLDLATTIDGIEEPTITAYFRTLNQENFTATADLFTTSGCLNPPFEGSIEGRAAIATYLKTEARGMILCPKSGVMLIRGNEVTQYHIQGQVKTNYFTINVAWLFQLNLERDILLVEVKLLAALDELLKFKK